MSLLVACGLKREAAIIAKRARDIEVLVGGGDRVRLERELDDAAELWPGIVLSFGLAGALDPSLCAGDLVIDGERAVVARLRDFLPGARIGAVIGSEAIVSTVRAKRSLASATGAIAVDMETAVARDVARRRNLPFGVIRAISDTAGDALPPAALVGMRPDGGMALGAVLASLARNPVQLGALIRTGRHAGRAFRSLDMAAIALGRAGLDRDDIASLAAD